MKKSTVDTWVFDLDNTLYPPSVRLFDQIEAKMEAYIIREIGTSQEAAKQMRADFWRDHGTTLEGLMTVYDINPEPFLEEVHDIDHSNLHHAELLKTALLNLKGHRMIYTNGSRKHAEQVTTALGIRDCFHAIYGIEDANYKPKPKAEAFHSVFQRAGVESKRAAMFEDDPRNLLVPFEMGMETILVGDAQKADHIGHQTHDLAGYLMSL